jgi:hypothetical protein
MDMPILIGGPSALASEANPSKAIAAQPKTFLRFTIPPDRQCCCVITPLTRTDTSAPVYFAAGTAYFKIADGSEPTRPLCLVGFALDRLRPVASHFWATRRPSAGYRFLSRHRRAAISFFLSSRPPSPRGLAAS